MNATLIENKKGIGSAPTSAARIDGTALWKERAVWAYANARLDIVDDLRSKLSHLIGKLTGCTPMPEMIYVDAERRLAAISVDNTLFRLEGDALQIERPCVYCGTGQLRSYPVTNVADLGYALVAWQPRHASCLPEDSMDWIYKS